MSASPTASPALVVHGLLSLSSASCWSSGLPSTLSCRGRAWDPYPFILLNLFLSMLAAIQAPVIMMSQNRQDKKDRLRSELDFDVNRRAEAEIQNLSRKLNLVTDKLGDLDDMLRHQLDAPAGAQPGVK